MTHPQPLPGWYPDPAQPATLRWWNGTSWTDQIRADERVAPTLNIQSHPVSPPSSPQASARPNVFDRTLNRWMVLQTGYKILAISGIVAIAVSVVAIGAFMNVGAATDNNHALTPHVTEHASQPMPPPAAIAPAVTSALPSTVAAPPLTPAAPPAGVVPVLTEQENEFVTKLARGAHDAPPIYPAPGLTAWDLAQVGHLIAEDVRHGVAPSVEGAAMMRTPGNTLSLHQWSFVTVTAVKIFAPDFAKWYWGPCGTGPVCDGDTDWPEGAVMTPWHTPGIPPFVGKNGFR